MKRRELMLGTLALPGGLLTGCCWDSVRTYDVVVIGGGGAGLSAAVSAAELGASVLLLEKLPSVGGNTALSTGFYSAVNPELSARFGIRDNLQDYVDQMLLSGRGQNDPALVWQLARNALPTLQWISSYGLKLQDALMSSQGSGGFRDHRPIRSNGRSYVDTLLAAAMKLGVDVRTSHPVTQILRSKVGGNVDTIEVRQGKDITRFKAQKGIVIASGGFGANLKLVAQYAPRLAGLNSHNSEGNTGEMMFAAQAVGACLKDMGSIQCLPGSPPGRRRRVRLHTDQAWFILINQQGSRFVREDALRFDLQEAILDLPGRLAYTLVDDVGMRAQDILIQKETVLGVESGDAWRTESLSEMAQCFGVDGQSLIQTVAEYNLAVRTGRDKLGRLPMYMQHPIIKPPFWGCYAGLSVHTTMGGIVIDCEARCLDSQDRPIAHLFAAGETTAGVHGRNRLGGHGLPDAMVFGRIAGRNAVLMA